MLGQWDGGCAPELNFETFGFVTAPETEVDFRVIKRWQYYSLTPNGFENLELAPNLKEFVERAHRHAGKADLVITKHQFAKGEPKSSAMNQPLWLVKSVVLVNLIDEIVDAVQDSDFDGVTIDFDNIDPKNEGTASYRFFIKRLNNKLKNLSPERQLNVVVPSGESLVLLKELAEEGDFDFFLANPVCKYFKKATWPAA